MLNPDKNLILIKGEDKTASIESWRFDKYKPVLYITYNNKKTYPYTLKRVFVLSDTEFVQRYVMFFLILYVLLNRCLV